MDHTPYIFQNADQDGDDKSVTDREVELSKMIHRSIMEEYPGHLWRTKVWNGGKAGGYMLGVGLNILMHANDWFIIKSEQISTYQDFRLRIRDSLLGPKAATCCSANTEIARC
jgi:hypothetical protein